MVDWTAQPDFSDSLSTLRSLCCYGLFCDSICDPYSASKAPQCKAVFTPKEWNYGPCPCWFQIWFMVHPATHCVKLSTKTNGQQIHKPIENKQDLKKSTWITMWMLSCFTLDTFLTSVGMLINSCNQQHMTKEITYHSGFLSAHKWDHTSLQALRDGKYIFLIAILANRKDR